jgi:hypothetical protein
MAKIERIPITDQNRQPLDVITLSLREAQSLVCALTAQMIGVSEPWKTSSSFTVEDEGYVPSRIAICVDRNEK